jgi:MFS family permease
LEYAIATVIIPIYFLEKGISLPITTLVSGIVMIPWMVKFIFGGIVDFFIRFGRKFFIIIGGLIGAIGFFILAFIDPGFALIPFAFLLFIGHCGIAFIDVSADALAIQISKEEERGKINGSMYSGLFIGMAFGTSIIALLAENIGYTIAIFLVGIIILIILIFPLMIKEEKIVKKHQKISPLLKKEFKKRNTQLVSIFLFIAALSYGLLAFAIPLYMKNILDFDIAQIGLITTIIPVTTVIGSIVGGITSDKWDRKINLYFFLGVNMILASLLVFATTWQKLAIIYGIIGFLHGGYYSVGGAVMMDLSNPKIGATQYSLLASFANAGEFGIGIFSGSMIAILGFSRVFLYSGWFYGPAILVLYFIKLQNKKKKSVFT